MAPKLRSKSYNPNMDLELNPDLHMMPHDLRWDIDGTRAGDRVKSKLRFKSYNANLDLELEPELELIPLNKLPSLWYLYGDKNLR